MDTKVAVGAAWRLSRVVRCSGLSIVLVGAALWTADAQAQRLAMSSDSTPLNLTTFTEPALLQRAAPSQNQDAAASAVVTTDSAVRLRRRDRRLHSRARSRRCCRNAASRSCPANGQFREQHAGGRSGAHSRDRQDRLHARLALLRTLLPARRPSARRQGARRACRHCQSCVCGSANPTLEQFGVRQCASYLHTLSSNRLRWRCSAA